MFVGENKCNHPRPHMRIPPPTHTHTLYNKYWVQVNLDLTIIQSVAPVQVNQMTQLLSEPFFFDLIMLVDTLHGAYTYT